MASERPAIPARPARVAQIVATARRLLEAEGRDALTMRRIAAVMGMKAPSLYKHLEGKAAVEAALVEQGMVEMGDVLHGALSRAPDHDAVEAVLGAYRAEALAHSNLYRLATAGPLARDRLPPGLEDWAGEPFFLATGDPFVAQALWSFAHGMVILELDARFPPGGDLDRTWAAGARAFVS